MQSLLRRRIVRQFIKFGIVGASSTIIDWSIYLLLTRIFIFSYLIAKVLSFLVAVLNSFFWNRRWTFRSREKRQLYQFSKFITVAAVGLGLNTLIMYISVSKLKLHDIFGLILATAIVTFWNFIANKLWVFKASQPVVIE